MGYALTRIELGFGLGDRGGLYLRIDLFEDGFRLGHAAPLP